jgi:DegV family protein with EDD domain
MIEGLPVEIIDSTFSIGAEGLVATAATRAAVAGAGMEEVANAARSAISKMSSFLNVGSISYFLRLGRVDKSRVDSIEESHIVIFKDTKIVPYEKYPTKEESRRRLKELVKERVVKDTPLHVAISHAKAKKEAEEFKEWIQSQYDCAELWIGECTPVVAIHVSPESLAVAFYNE